MGTNYYLKTGRKIRKECSLGFVHYEPEILHIGKSSFGRYFTLHEMTTDDGIYLDSLQAWKDLFAKMPKSVIVDEYRQRVKPDEMWRIITREDWQPAPAAVQKFNASLIGKPVERAGTNSHYDWYDVWGERGFIHVNGRKIGKDGLYVMLEGEFS